MRGSWRIARLAGIDLSIHWTFAALLGWILFASVSGFGWHQGLMETLFFLALFGCVVLHELGHAMAARQFGIPTHGITLLPIGGVAQLDRIPRDPWQEWVIALAGPAVNVFIVGLLFPIVVVLQGAGGWASPLAVGGSFLARLMWVNVMLVCFNLIPAFPMDGGRVLRSFLARRTDYVTATLWAKRVGQGIAVLLAVWGLTVNPMLIVIAVFVFFAAQAEYRMVSQEAGGMEPIGDRPTLDRPMADVAFAALSGGSGVAGPHLPSDHPPTAAAATAIHQILPSGIIIIRTFPRGLSGSAAAWGGRT